MTSLQILYVASALGAFLFFAAGAIATAMRGRPIPVPAIAPPAARDDRETRALRDALEDARVAASTAERERDAHERRVREADTRAAEQARTMRDLATEAERLRGRIADAEALRADYVRLRTSNTDGEFLRTEVARLKAELQEVRQHALGTRPKPVPIPRLPKRPSNGSISIGESLVGALAQFADPHTRASAVADPLGFPLAATGDDGLALAAYGALLLEAATRASQFLPVARPASVEVIDERGARIAAYTFDVEADRLVLVNLAVDAVDHARLGTTLAELATILTPSARS